MRRFPESDFRRRPNITRRFFTECIAIRLKRSRIPILELGAFLASAVCWPVMKRHLQGFAAHFIPIRTRVAQVQMPDLIDFLARRDRMARRARQKHEPFVFRHHARGEIEAPTVVARKSRSKRQRSARLIQVERFHPRPQRTFFCCPLEHDISFLNRLIQAQRISLPTLNGD
jgi:hypothetical protein